MQVELIEQIRATLRRRPFVPFPGLENRHLMTMIPALVQRRFPLAAASAQKRLFQVASDSQVLALCHWQAGRQSKPTIVIVHGLEGSAEAHYVLGLAEKSLAYGYNVVRMNVRNCGETLHLTPSLYNSGMSEDVIAIVEQLKQEDGLSKIFLAGTSMGGNMVLKASAELANRGPEFLSGVCALSPALDLEACVRDLEKGFNRIYEQRFLKGLKDKIRRKHRLYPALYDVSHLPAIRRIREFDDCYTAPSSGYGTASNYYKQASALPIIDRIDVPTLIITAKDDPFIPFCSFESLEKVNPQIILLSPDHGGHGGFFQRDREDNKVFDRFWAENRVVSFISNVTECLQKSHLSDVGLSN